jgi:hypothetical protein
MCPFTINERERFGSGLELDRKGPSPCVSFNQYTNVSDNQPSNHKNTGYVLSFDKPKRPQQVFLSML